MPTSAAASPFALGVRLQGHVTYASQYTPNPMKTNIDIAISAVLYGVAGLVLVFAPHEISEFLGQDHSAFTTWTLQSLGAAYLAIGWMNFLNKHAMLGGIYGRPVLLLNVMLASPSFFFSFDLMQAYPDQPAFIGVTVIFGLLTAAFLRRLLGRGPAPDRGSE